MLLENSRVEDWNRMIGPGNSVEIDDCVSLKQLNAEDCALANSSTIDNNASVCLERCRKHAYALIHKPTCLCVPSKLYKLANPESRILCGNSLCTDDSTKCGGLGPATGQKASDCRYNNEKFLRYSSFIRNRSGMVARIFQSFKFSVIEFSSFSTRADEFFRLEGI